MLEVFTAITLTLTLFLLIVTVFSLHINKLERDVIVTKKLMIYTCPDNIAIPANLNKESEITKQKE